MSQHAEGRTVAELAELVGGRASGDVGTIVRRVSSIEAASEGDRAFVEGEAVCGAAVASRGSCVFVPEGSPKQLEGLRSVIEAARPMLAFALTAGFPYPPQ